MNLTLVGRRVAPETIDDVAALVGRMPDERDPTSADGSAGVAALPDRPASLEPATARLQRVRWHGVAATDAWSQALPERCWPAGVDFAFLPPAARLSDYALLAMDMDSTLITIECIDEIADCAGRKAEVSAITEAAMRGEIADYADSLRRRVALLRGLDASVLDRVYRERLLLTEGAESLLAAARAAGLRTLLVSGGFTFFTERLAQRLGLDHVLANRLEIVDGRLTGQVLGEIVDAQGKARELARVCETLGVPTTRAIAIGDGANDLAMMALAGLSVAFRAKPVVRARTTVAIQAGGLDALLRWLD